AKYPAMAAPTAMQLKRSHFITDFRFMFAWPNDQDKCRAGCNNATSRKAVVSARSPRTIRFARSTLPCGWGQEPPAMSHGNRPPAARITRETYDMDPQLATTG